MKKEDMKIKLENEKKSLVEKYAKLENEYQSLIKEVEIIEYANRTSDKVPDFLKDDNNPQK